MSNNRIQNVLDPAQVQHVAGLFKALAHPHRLSIFLRLRANCRPGTSCTDEEMRCCVGDISEGLGVAPSTVSHHLKELRQAGLIRMEKKGQLTECWVEGGAVETLRDFFGAGAPLPTAGCR